MDSALMAARVLVVEDDPKQHDLIVHVIRRAGHEPISAFTGEQALSILRAEGQHIDWLITDIRLPGTIDGWIVGSEFALSRPLSPIVYISGIEADFGARRASNSVFLAKPIDPRDLVEIFGRLQDAAKLTLG
jgi:two-component system, OmpR family, response regulator